MLPKKTTLLGRMYRTLRKTAQLSKHHPVTYEYFRSYPAVVAERQRQLLEEEGNVIHPLSLFSLVWMSVMMMVNLMHIVVSSFRLFFILQPIDDPEIHWLDLLMVGLQLVCLIDILIKLNTGYLNKSNFYIVMNKKSIFYHYLRRWFIVDLASSLPAVYVVTYLKASNRLQLIAHIMALLRTPKIYEVAIDLKIFLKLFTESYIVHGLVRLSVMFVLSSHWCSCLMYCPAVIVYYWSGEMPTHYNYYMRTGPGKKDLMGYDLTTRFNKAIIIALSAFFGTGFTLFRSTEPDEILIHSVIIVYAAMFMVFTLGKYYDKF
ncbi:unnamed protein product [Spodoptera exigua]|nr:unnamed protein product [Spodoptera exigua]